MSASVFKVLLKGPFSVYSGYGHDSLELARALRNWGADVYVQPTWVDVPVPGDLLPLFGKPLEGPFDLTINHWCPDQLEISRMARESTRLAVAWTMWEMTTMGHLPGRSKIRGKLRWFDAVLGYSDVTMAALGPYIPKHVHRGVLQGGFEASEWEYAERDWSDGAVFRFGMHGALNRRKGWEVALQAFLELCEERPEFKAGARMLFHTNVPSLIPEMNEIYERAGIGVRVYLGVWDKPTLEKFYRSCHALVYPSHGEGKNLPALEHAATGGAEIVTDWSGHQNWLSADYAYPLACTVEPMDPAWPGRAHWAVVPVAEVKRAMWHVYTHRAEAKAKGDLAARTIPRMCSWDTVVEALFRRLRDLVPGPGETVYNLAMACRRDQPGEVPDGLFRG